MGILNRFLGTGFFVVKMVEFITYRISYIILRGRLYIIVLNVHATTGDKNDDTRVVL
jgi:hypothetical protein